MGNELDPKYIIHRNFINFPNVFKLRNDGVDKKILDSRYCMIQQDLERVAKEAGAIIIKPMDFLCKDNKCESLDTQGNAIYKDDCHLCATFSRKHAAFIDQTVR